MFYELARAFVQKIFQDKILAGLVIVGFLSIFVGGFGGGHGHSGDRIATGPRGERTASKGQQEEEEDAAPQKQATPRNQGQHSQASPKPTGSSPTKNAAKEPLSPKFANEFVTWWIGKAMDFNPQTAAQNRQEALQWVAPEVQASYTQAFWSPESADAILTGRVRGSFTPTSVNPIAANPDGSIVVNVTGQLMLQQGPRPSVQNLSTDYLVKRETGGLRIGGLFNRAVSVPGNSTY